MEWGERGGGVVTVSLVGKVFRSIGFRVATKTVSNLEQSPMSPRKTCIVCVCVCGEGGGSVSVCVCERERERGGGG